MTVESWKQEYYPIPASDVEPEKAAQHSLRKWTGLRQANLKAHGVTLTDLETKIGTLRYDTSCALCLHFSGGHHLDDIDDCSQCPLAIVRGGAPCTHRLPRETLSPYLLARRGYPTPLINWLRRAVKEQERA